MLALSLAALLLVDAALAAPADTQTVSGRSIPIPHMKRQTITGTNGYQFNVLEHLAGISPYFDSPGVQLNPAPPQGCEVSTATYLVRHSNIYANDFDYESYLEPFISKLANFTDRPSFANVSNLAFLSNWTSPITNATEQVEKLTPSGAQAASAFGSLIANLYPSLAPFNSSGSDSANASFKVWAATAERSLDSARAFMQGAFPQNGSQLMGVDEGKEASANSLAPHESCPNFEGSAGSIQSGQFMDIYTAPIIQRLNAALPSFNFTATDVVAMQQLCGYETIIRNSSGFCNAFDEVDWLGFEYTNDLMYFYSIGYGNPIGPQLGMPWVNASAALLTAPSPTAQKLYISFTHREEPPLALTALGLFNNSAYTPSLDVNTTMPASSINFARAWRTSDILPFLGHVALERLECPGLQAPNSGNSTAGNSTSGEETSATSFVRALVNGAPIPFPACQDGPGASCALGEFVGYIQERAQRYGDFDAACGVNATNATNVLGIYQ